MVNKHGAVVSACLAALNDFVCSSVHLSSTDFKSLQVKSCNAAMI